MQDSDPITSKKSKLNSTSRLYRVIHDSQANVVLAYLRDSRYGKSWAQSSSFETMRMQPQAKKASFAVLIKNHSLFDNIEAEHAQTP